MNKRIILLSLFVTCIALSLSAQQKRLGVYAAAFYNLENLWSDAKVTQIVDLD